jgi:hypothetical protein
MTTKRSQTRMSSQSRRQFCAVAGGTPAALVMRRLAFGEEALRYIPDVAAIDRHRILTAAGRYLRERPVTITAFLRPRIAGGKHDYFSQGDYLVA